MRLSDDDNRERKVPGHFRERTLSDPTRSALMSDNTYYVRSPSPRPNRGFSFLSASFSLVQLKPASDWFATMALRSSAPSGFYAHRSNCVRRLPSLRAGTAALAARTSTQDLFHLALHAAKA